jgi:hypothetical protein
MNFLASEDCEAVTLNVLKAFRPIRTRDTLDLGHYSRRQADAVSVVKSDGLVTFALTVWHSFEYC